jgi:hypothetical protein
MHTRNARARLTGAQRRVLDNDDLGWVGWDVKRRPVVIAFFHDGVLQRWDMPHSRSILCRWAILRNGQRVKPAWPIVFFDPKERDRYEQSQ